MKAINMAGENVISIIMSVKEAMSMSERKCLSTI